MLRKLLIAGLLLISVPAAVHAAALTTAGFRAGFSIDPDQVVLGGQMEVGDIAPSVSFVPNLDIGFGDHLTVIAFGFDLHYNMTIRDSDWRPYAGAGLGIHFVEVDRAAPFDGSSTEVGGNFLLGASVPTRSGNLFFTELKLGLGDVPTLKLLAGLNFRL
jgi:hypothetical protein